MTTTTLAPIPNTFQADYETRQANRARFNGLKHDDECFLCGRGLTRKAVDNGRWIHLRTDGQIQPWGVPVEADDLSQGAFPVGSECARQIPKGYTGR